MSISDLSIWSTILQMAATESTSPISSFIDPVQAIQQMYIQNTQGDDIQAITRDGKIYWLVTSTLATKLNSLGFYPLLATGSLQA